MYLLFHTEICFIFLLLVISSTVKIQDATANDIPSDVFDVKGYPTLYFRSASGNLSQYDGDRTKDDMIEFIQKNRDKTAHRDTGKDEL